jgi:DNA-binding beta-propeller fold protein YncE
LGPAVTVGNGPQAVTVDITGQYVYVANEQDGTIAALVIGSGGALAATTSVVGTGSGPYAITTAF